MVICVANTNPERVKRTLKKLGFSFSMWKGETSKGDYHGFFNFEDILKSKTKKTPFFFNIVSAFAHIEMNYPIFRYDFKDFPNGMVHFTFPNEKLLKEVLQKSFSSKMLSEVHFRPTKMKVGAGSELARRWNNFILTLPQQVAETFMVAFLTYVRNNDVKGFHQFVVDNRLVGTPNKEAYAELDEILRCMWRVMHALSAKTDKAESTKKNFLKKNPSLDTSLSRFLFWNKSYKGKLLEDFMDNENNVAYGIKV